MGVFQTNGRVTPHILQLLFINFVGWFIDIALAQEDVFANAFGSVDFPITSLINLSVFVVTLIRGTLDLENGAREAMGMLRGPKLYQINEKVLTTVRMKGKISGSTEEGQPLAFASVVILSNGAPNASMKEFVKSSARDDVESIVLQYQPLQNAMKDVKGAISQCSSDGHGCNCIVFHTLEEITGMLHSRMPRPLKELPGNRCLLPCYQCLQKGCHGETLSPGAGQVVESVVYGMLDDIHARYNKPMGSTCICIPVKDAQQDDWTNFLVTSSNTKDASDRGVRTKALKALQEYVNGNGGRGSPETVYYSPGSFIGPRISEILINLLLTFWFTVDGFSSSMAARRTVRNYLVDCEGKGLAANAFLTEANVNSDPHNKHVIQVLTFRGNLLSLKTLSFIAGGFNLICFIGWAMLIPFGGGNSAPPLSVPRILVIITAIGIACLMDCLYMFTNKVFLDKRPDYKVLLAISLEIACIVVGSVVARLMGIKVFGKWVYMLCKYLFGSSGQLEVTFLRNTRKYHLVINMTSGKFWCSRRRSCSMPP